METNLLKHVLSAACEAPSDVLYTARQLAKVFLTKHGLPNRTDENWKYTDLNPLLQFDWNDSPPASFNKIALPASIENDTDCDRLVFVNGRYDKGLSSVNTLPQGVVMCSFAEALLNHHDLITLHAGKAISASSDPFISLNTMSSADGAFIVIPAKTTIPRPVLLIFIGEATTGNFLVQPRNMILAGSHSSISVSELYFTNGSVGSILTNVITEIECGKASKVQYAVVKKESDKSFNISSAFVKQEEQSSLSSLQVSLTGAISRNNFFTDLIEKDAMADLNGLYAIDGSAHADFRTLIHHSAAGCRSNQLYKGILHGKSTAVFSGKILVKEDAQQTNAFQSNKNILVSDQASVQSIPQLEIFADDVKCTHGSTTGQVDKEALFYLQARGIARENALQLLLRSFADEVIQKAGNNVLSAIVAAESGYVNEIA